MRDVTPPLPTLDVKEFVRSMPAAYGAVFSARDAEEHARVVARRQGELSHVEVVGGKGSARTLVCLVAEDRPGLLSIVTDALLAQGLVVRSAHIYCRTRADGRLEAVDFFELAPKARRDEPRALEPADVASFAATLRQILAEQLPLEFEMATLPPPPAERTRVYFDLEAMGRGEHVLIVQAPDFPGLLFSVTNALHTERARVISSEVRTLDGMADDRFELSTAGTEPLSASRLCDIQLSVYVAVVAARARG
jgi:UTP:GlnB (protein PII) uridylyltransferase